MSAVAFDIPAGEGGVLRLFRLNTDHPDAAALRAALQADQTATGALAGRALGLNRVDAWWVTPVVLRDLREIGLATYLADGHDVPRALLSEAADLLTAAEADPDATLLIVQSPAFGGAAATLHPAPWLVPLAQFDTLHPPAPARPMDRARSGPAGDTGADRAAPPNPVPARPGLILAALAAAALVVGLIAMGAR